MAIWIFFFSQYANLTIRIRLWKNNWINEELFKWFCDISLLILSRINISETNLVNTFPHYVELLSPTFNFSKIKPLWNIGRSYGGNSTRGHVNCRTCLTLSGIREKICRRLSEVKSSQNNSRPCWCCLYSTSLPLRKHVIKLCQLISAATATKLVKQTYQREALVLLVFVGVNKSLVSSYLVLISLEMLYKWFFIKKPRISDKKMNVYKQDRIYQVVQRSRFSPK